MTKNARSRAHGEEAQGLIEFAIIAMVLMFLFMGTVDFSRFLYYDTAIQNAARVGVETAVNRCSSSTTCSTDLPSLATPTQDDVVLHATVCEAMSTVQLQPSPGSGSGVCDPCVTTLCGASTTACGGASACCGQDVCISPSPTRTSGSDVTVTVGYNFQPITPLISQFFPTKTCFSNSSSESAHTLCTSITGRVD